MYVNGLGFRAIERITGVNHNTVIRWVRHSAETLPDVPLISEIPEITEIYVSSQGGRILLNVK
jgi:hypothetical protein